MTHQAICRQNDNSGWLTLHERDGHWEVVSTWSASLEPIITGIIADMRKSRGSGDFSFSSRRLDEIVAAPVAEGPDDLQALVGASITILSPEGKPGDETTWNCAWLDPTGHLNSPGVGESRFRVQCVGDQVERWFEREVYRSFEPPRQNERFAMNPIQRPTFHRELLVRRAWQTRDLVPTAFPAAQVTTRQQEQIAAAKAVFLERQRLKNPRTRRLERQAQWAREREARKVDPVAAEKARKAKYGLDWGHPPDSAA